jgi:hypothetical protein
MIMAELRPAGQNPAVSRPWRRRSQTYEALRSVIPALLARGYIFVAL